MKQILQNIKSGETFFEDSPIPQSSKGKILISSRVSLLSIGTEKMLVTFGESSYLTKALSNKERVKDVLSKIKTDGLLNTLDAIKHKLDQPIPLGYSNVGVVAETSEGFLKGQRVVSNGPHAEVVCVNKNLCALIPDNVDDDSAAFTIIASIALQSIRLANVSIGESILVIGTGLVGLLTVQLLIANGCRVIAVDYDTSKLELAEEYGATTINLSQVENVDSFINSFTDHKGMDGVIIAASTESNDPIRLAAKSLRKRGRIILSGISGLSIDRSLFYEKELTFQVSCSYGPGRYDYQYEDLGIDYPIGYVRWTAQRNFSAVLNLMAEGKLNVKGLISKKVKFDDALSVYQKLSTNNSSIGIIFEYNQDKKNPLSREIFTSSINPTYKINNPVIGIIGAGNYASRTLIPSIIKNGGSIHTIVSNAGLNATQVARKFNILKASSSAESVFDNQDINTVFIVTRHNTHAQFVIKALARGQNVFVEKPLAMTHYEIDKIEQIYRESQNGLRSIPRLMVGFNRRFSSHVIRMKELLDNSPEPKIIIMTINAGALPSDHWSKDAVLGGGRILGECCHFFDLARHLAGTMTHSFSLERLGNDSNDNQESFAINIKFIDGSLATINYFTNGNRAYAKEKIDIFVGGRSLHLDNYINLTGHGWKYFKKYKLWRQDKGQHEMTKRYLSLLIKGTEKKSPLIAIDEIFEIAKLTIDIADAAIKKT